MAETFMDGRVVLHCGDVRKKLRAMKENSIDCVVTSPPYWGLRDYGVKGQLGLEPSLGEHIATMVDVMREVRRVLKPNGSLWLNLGDCYATAPNGRSAADTKAAGKDDRTFRDKPFSTVGPIYDHACDVTAGKHLVKGRSKTRGRIRAGGFLKPKDLCMVANRIAIALQDDGWWVRAENVWGKTNGMPDSSGRYRPGTAHEKIFLLTKTGKSYYDAAAVSPVAAYANSGRTSKTKAEFAETRKRNGKDGKAASFRAIVDERLLRNYEPAPLTVWAMPTDPFPDAHFATFPAELAERCIKAGCPPEGIVLDPFGGSGTTALVALSLGRSAVLIELSKPYCKMARARIEAAFTLGKDEGRRHMVKSMGLEADPGPLFAQAAP